MNNYRFIGTLIAIIPAAGLFYLGHYGIGLFFIILLAGLTYITMATMGFFGFILLPIMLVLYGVTVWLFFYFYENPKEISRKVIIGSIGKALIGVILLVGLNYYAFSSAASIYFLSASEQKELLAKAEAHVESKYNSSFVLKSHSASFGRGMGIVYAAPEPDAPGGEIEFSVQYYESLDRVKDDYLQRLWEFEGRQIVERLVHRFDEQAEVDFTIEPSDFEPAKLLHLEQIRQQKGFLKSMEIEIITNSGKRPRSGESLVELKQLLLDFQNELRMDGVPLHFVMRTKDNGDPLQLNINQDITTDMLRKLVFRLGAGMDLSEAVAQKVNEIYPHSNVRVELEVEGDIDDSLLAENFVLQQQTDVIKKYSYEVSVSIDQKADSVSMPEKTLQIIKTLVPYSKDIKSELEFDFDISYYDDASETRINKRVHLLVPDATSVRSIQDLKFKKTS